MVLYHYDEQALAEVAAKAVQQSCRLIDDFDHLLDNDPMVNFDVPSHLGIGIARGATTRLRSGDTILDYSGRPLNLAARLMDLARPEGVIFDGTLNHGVLPDELLENFSTDDVFIRGIAETDAHQVFYQTGHTEVPERAHQPIGRYSWRQQEVEGGTLAQFREMGLFIHFLDEEPAFPEDVRLELHHSAVTPGGYKSRTMNRELHYETEFIEHPEGPRVRVRYDRIAKDLKEQGVRDSWPIRALLQYKVASAET